MDAKGERVFVANKPNGTLDVVDLKTGQLVKQIADQGKASGVAYSEELDCVYVGNGAGTCNAFEGKEYKLVFSAQLPKADNVNYHAGAKRVYVAHGSTITALDAKTGEAKATVPLPGDAHGFVIDEKADKLYVDLTKPNQIGVIDLAKHEITDKFPVTLATGNGPVALDAANGRLFVGCRKEPMVIVLDTKTGKELSSVAIPGDIDDLLFDVQNLVASTRSARGCCGCHREERRQVRGDEGRDREVGSHGHNQLSRRPAVPRSSSARGYRHRGSSRLRDQAIAFHPTINRPKQGRVASAISNARFLDIGRDPRPTIVAGCNSAPKSVEKEDPHDRSRSNSTCSGRSGSLRSRCCTRTFALRRSGQ